MKIRGRKKIAIFAGTTEGRLRGETGRSNVRRMFSSRRSTEKRGDPGGTESPCLHDGRIDENGMEDLFRENGNDPILDATHPFAKAVTANIREAAKKTDTAFLRIPCGTEAGAGIRVQTLEEIQKMAAGPEKLSWYFVDSVCTAVEFLKMTGRTGLCHDRK